MDAQSLQQLIDQCGPALRLYARQWCHSPDDAVQEAFIDLLQKDPPPEQVVPWLYTVVRRRAMNLARADSRRLRHQTRAAQDQTWFVHGDDSEQTDDALQCQQCLARLPALEREIVTARIWGELSFAEIAQLTSVPLSTVHRRYHAALAQLESVMTTESDLNVTRAEP